MHRCSKIIESIKDQSPEILNLFQSLQINKTILSPKTQLKILQINITNQVLVAQAWIILSNCQVAKSSLNKVCTYSLGKNQSLPLCHLKTQIILIIKALYPTVQERKTLKCPKPPRSTLMLHQGTIRWQMITSMSCTQHRSLETRIIALRVLIRMAESKVSTQDRPRTLGGSRKASYSHVKIILPLSISQRISSTDNK